MNYYELDNSRFNMLNCAQYMYSATYKLLLTLCTVCVFLLNIGGCTAFQLWFIHAQIVLVFLRNNISIYTHIVYWLSHLTVYITIDVQTTTLITLRNKKKITHNLCYWRSASTLQTRWEVLPYMEHLDLRVWYKGGS